MTTDKHSVRISRDWHNPAITIAVTHDEIAVSMPLADFVKALLSEVGNPLFVFTRKQLEAKLVLAAETITTSMKRETTAVV